MFKRFIVIGVLISFFLPGLLTAGTTLFGFGPGLIGTYNLPYSVSAQGRGGYEMGFIDSLNVNQMNYALWTKIERTTICLNFDYTGVVTKLNKTSAYSTDANFQGGMIVIPLKPKKLILGLGLSPRISNNTGIQLTQVGPDHNATQKIQSTGNLSEALFIGSWAFSDRLSMAFDGGYNFGVITEKNSLLYNDITYGDIVIRDDLQMQGTNFGLSGYYEISNNISIGVRYKTPTKITIHSEQNSVNFTSAVKHTRSVNLPALYVIGLNYKLAPRWQIGIDGVYQDWSKFYQVDETYVRKVTDSYRLGAGFEKSPTDKRFVPYIEDISWRGGFFFSRLNVTVNNNPVYEYGITAGIGLPIRKNRNRIDIALEYGRRGDATTNLIHENFFGITFSLVSSELWFVREKR